MAVFPPFLRRRRSFRGSYFFNGGRCVHSAVEHPLTYPIYTVWGSNTSLGKTLVSAGLSMTFLTSEPFSKKRFLYVKPLQTGFPDDSDSRFVYAKFCEYFTRSSLPFSVLASNHVFKASAPAAPALSGYGSVGDKNDGFVNANFHEEKKLRGIASDEDEFRPRSELVCLTMHAWKAAVSPHLAAESEEAFVEDSQLLDMLKRSLSGAFGGAQGLQDMCVIETAGGVASPGPAGTLQCDLYRPLRLPAILVGDGRLGGISGTISAYETLKLRGYDVAAVIFEDNGLKNEVPLVSYFRDRIPVLVLPSIPTDLSDNLIEWFQKSQPVFGALSDIMLSDFQERVHQLCRMPKQACDIFWWPFTQHGLVPEDKVTVIDSRCGENFSILKHRSFDCISQQFDACASWWTQGPDAPLQIELARNMGYAAARYGHVMFPENVYQPSLELAELLLEGVGKGWASRVYFSDNGSTAVEVALKMAFRKFLFDNGFIMDNADDNYQCFDLKVLALRGSYHGDTLGAMEAQASSPYTGFLQQPWYSGRGVFLDPPTVCLRNGMWEVLLTDNMLSQRSGHKPQSFSSLDDVFVAIRDDSDLSRFYSSFIRSELQSDNSRVSRVGALIIEPVVHGAGGMQMIDPLYQKILVRECKKRKVPVIFDEVFTGFWRLGRESAAKLLGCEPDIACFAKLMTGGIIPLAVTLASSAVFDAFKSDSKLHALLHGHSYSAHAMGCTAAVKAIKWFKNSETNNNLVPAKESLRELWKNELVVRLSSLPNVSRVVALGTLCAIELAAEGSDAGYGSTCGRSVVDQLHRDGIYMRPLGNVLYMMCGPCTSPATCDSVLERVYSTILRFGRENDDPATAMMV